jgi:hypothetical protein
VTGHRDSRLPELGSPGTDRQTGPPNLSPSLLWLRQGRWGSGRSEVMWTNGSTALSV